MRARHQNHGENREETSRTDDVVNDGFHLICFVFGVLPSANVTNRLDADKF